MEPGLRPRLSGHLVASLALSGATLLLPSAMGPVGPFVAGVLALFGHRAVRASKGALRGPRIAIGAMTLALLLFAMQAWVMVSTVPVAAAWTEIRAKVAAVDANLRTGTPEGAWELLDPAAREGMDRVAFTGALRRSMEKLGPLETLGETAADGGDWERTEKFTEGESAVLRLPMVIPGTFRGGKGRIRLEVVVAREGKRVTGALTGLRVEEE